MKKEDLDKRICDVEPNSTNTQTYREYIDWGYRFLEIGDFVNESNEKTLYERTADLDVKTDKDLTDIIEELDWLLEK